MRYDILILGGGVAAQQAALEAARLGRRVALVAPPAPLADVDPDQPVLDVLSALDALTRLVEQRAEQEVAPPLAPGELRDCLEQILREESEIVRQHLEWSGVNVLCGEPRLINSHAVEIESPGNYWVLGADHILVACGTRASRPASVPFDGQRILTADDLLALDGPPERLAVIGSGRTGLSVAASLAMLGSRVALFESRTADQLASDPLALRLLKDAEAAGVQMNFGVEAVGVERLAADRAVLRFADASAHQCSHVLWSSGRVGRTSNLNLEVAGIEPDESRRLWCNDLSQTWAPHIYAVGDAVGYGPLAGDATEAGTEVIRQIFGTEKVDDRPLPAEIERAELIGT